MQIVKNRLPLKIPTPVRHHSELLRFSTEVCKSIKILNEKLNPQILQTTQPLIPKKQIPWSPLLRYQEGSGYFVRFNPGTLNGILADNWQTEFALPTSSSQTNYVVLSFTASNSQITSCTLSLDASAPAPNSVEENATASAGKFIIGVTSSTSVFMLYNENLVAYGNKIATIGKTVTSAGGEPFNRFFQWVVVEAVAQV